MAITKPFTFVAGTKARANEVNQNFDVLYSEVNSIDSTLTSIDVDIQSLQDDKANMIFKSSVQVKDISMNDLLKDAISLIDGRGGGSHNQAQGGGKNNSNLKSAMEYAMMKINKQLK